MQVTLTISDKGDAVKARDFLNQMLGEDTPAKEPDDIEDDDIEKEDKPKPRKTKKKVVKKKVAKKPPVEEHEEIEDDEDLDEPEDDDEPEYTDSDVRNALKAFAKKHGKAKTIKKLQKYGTTTVADLDESDYADLIADLT